MISTTEATPFSPEFLECRRLLDAWDRACAGHDEDAIAAVMAQYSAAEAALLARPPRTLQDLRERAILWKLDDSGSPTKIEVAVLAAIEAVVPGGLPV